MRKIIILLTFILPNTLLFGQTFVGTSTDKLKAYNCTIRVNKDSTINFIYNKHSNVVYGEHIGTISKVSDTLYKISATMTIGQFLFQSPFKDTIYVQLDSTIARQADKIQFEYSYGKTRKQLQGYDRLRNAIGLFKIPVDKNIFKEKKGTDFITLTIDRKNFLTDNFLSFTIPFGSAASFTKGQLEAFYVVIKNGQLYTIGNPPLQTGHFKLKEK
ncbi:hypothetical protein ACVWYG_000010 [Pedobacter sp. UYEF25]